MLTTTTSLLESVANTANLSTGFTLLILLAVSAIILGAIYLSERHKSPSHHISSGTRAFMIAYAGGVGTAYVILLIVHLLGRLF